jgi:predicted nucleic acid-binding protein
VSFVVDCSVTARWFLPDESTAYSEAALDLLASRQGVVPGLWLSEFANVFLKLERHKLLAADLAEGVAARAEALGLQVDRDTPAPARLFQLARTYGISAYDATYLEVALRRGIPLACLDGGLRQAARRAGLFLELQA